MSEYGPPVPEAAPVWARDQRALVFGAVATMAIALYGAYARHQIIATGMVHPQALNVFFRLYALYELPFLCLTFVAGALLLAAILRRPTTTPVTRWLFTRWPEPTARAALVPALAVFLVSLAVARFVLHGYALSMDEFSVDFQAHIFAHGQIRAIVPPSWQPFGNVITPIFVGFHPGLGYWVTEYLPTYAALKSPFVAVGAGLLLNPLCAGVSVLLMAAIARRLWPGERFRPWVAVALLATSTEFIITSGSQYTMPAHLCLNLAWLLLYLRDDAWSWAGATIVGATALGLHHPFSHAIFVTPFLVRLLMDRRWARLASISVVYAAACALWIYWLRMSGTAHANPGALAQARTLLSIPRTAALWLQGIDISLLFTWQTPVFGLLVLAAMLRSKRLPRVFRELGLGVFLAILFYACRGGVHGPVNQGHGWGDRYAYEVLGNLVLLAALGAGVLRGVLGRERTLGILAASLVVTLLVQWPIRFVNTESFVRPFAAGEAYLRTRPADVVIVKADSVWYGRDLLRNDPYLRGQPTIVDFSIAPAQRARLEQEHPGRVVEVTNAELLALGMTPWLHRH